MMLIISDYDQTINFRGKVDSRDRDAFASFIKQGNIIAISSSRNFESLYNDVESHNIPYSYLCCNNGNAIFNHSELLDFNTLNSDELSAINQFLPYFPEHTTIYPCNAYGFIDLINPVFIKIFLPENENFVEYVHHFNENGIETDYYKNYGLLFSKSRDKNYAGLFISQLCDIQKSDIYAIGDGDNDFTMLQNFNGYSFPWRSDMVKELDIPIVSSVSHMITDIKRVRK